MLESPARFKVIPAGRRSGKTEWAKRTLVDALLTDFYQPKPWPDPRYFFAGPTRDQAKRIAWNDFKRMVPGQWLAAPPRETDLELTTRWGSTLAVLGMDKPARMEGVGWDGGVVDECSDHRPNMFDLTIRPALADRNGWCWLIGVPKRKGPGAEEYRARFEYAASGVDPDWAAFTWFSSGIVSQSELRAAARAMAPKDYREQFEASWETAGNRVYEAFEAEYNVRPCQYHPGQPIIVGSDFNVSPMAWVLCHQYRNPDRLEVFEEIWLTDATTQITLDELHKRYSHHQGGFQFYGDATSRSRHASAVQTDYAQIAADPRFVKLGRTTHYRGKNPAQADRYASVNALCRNALGERRLFIDPSCANLIYDLEHGYYAEGTREAQQTDRLSHITAALGYACHLLYPIGFNFDEPDIASPIGIARG